MTPRSCVWSECCRTTRRPRPTGPEAPPTGPDAPEGAAAEPKRSRGLPFGLPFWPTILLTVVVLDIIVFFLFPPFSPADPSMPAQGIPDFILANFELPAPHVIWDLSPDTAPSPDAIVFFHPSITSSILTTWIVMVLILAVGLLATRRMLLHPGWLQNALETAFEMLSNFAISLGGSGARRYVPLFAGMFIFILISNWIGLLPVTGRLIWLRAPTSDLNVTLGLALVSFLIFEFEGISHLGFRGYIGKFFSLRAFKKEGLAAGLISLYVGLIEFTLEFIKPVTLAMRLFGNIFGGEIALGVITALTFAILPTLMLGLEVLLNFIQALIFSVLTLMYTLIAIESHEEEDHAAPEFANDPEGGMGAPLSSMDLHAPAH